MDPLEAFKRARVMKLSLRSGVKPSFDSSRRCRSGWPLLMFVAVYAGLMSVLCLLATESMVFSAATFFLIAIAVGQVFQLHTERRLFVPVVVGSCLILLAAAVVFSGVVWPDVPQLATHHVSEFIGTVLGWFGA